MRSLRFVALASLLLVCSGYGECYKPVGRGDALPKHIKKIAIPAFQNPSLRYKVEQRFTAALIDETLRRARSIEVVSSPEGADALVLGTIKSFIIRPVLLDDIGRARLVEVAVIVGLTIRDQTKNKIIFDNQNYVFRSEYEVTGDPQSYFNEEAPATERLARDFARSLMTTVMEGF